MKKTNHLTRKLTAATLTVFVTAITFTFVNCSGFSNSTSDGAGNEAPLGILCTQEQLDSIEARIRSRLLNTAGEDQFAIHFEDRSGEVLVVEKGGVTMDTRMDSASTSKWVTASVILEYMQQSEKSNRNKSSDFGFKASRLLTSEEWPVPPSDSLCEIKLKNLLAFTAGLTDEPSCIMPGSPSVTLAECVRNVANSNVGNGKVPGAEFYYSGTHLHVAGLMALRAREQARGLSNTMWKDLFNEFKTRTGVFGDAIYDLPSELNPRLAGGMRWTGNEYASFLRKYLHRKLFSSAQLPGYPVDLHDLQLIDQRATATTINSPAFERTGQDWHYGFGLWLECESETFNCPSIQYFSSAGAFGAYPMISPQKNYFVMLAKKGGLGTGFTGYELAKSVRQDVEKWFAKDCAGEP